MKLALLQLNSLVARGDTEANEYCRNFMSNCLFAIATEDKSIETGYC